MTAKPLFSWLTAWRTGQLHGRVEAIYVAPNAGVAVRSVEKAEAVVGQGLAGDRYAAGTGHWKTVDAVEVTLVRAEDLRAAEKRSGVSFAHGEHRRNLVVSGIPVDAYRRRRFRVGEALLEFHRLRPPCGYLDRVAGRGTAKALGKAAGIGARVIVGGRIRVGDSVDVLADETRPAP